MKGRYEYKTVDISTVAGLRKAERMVKAGWRIRRIYRGGLFTMMLERKVAK